MNLPHRFIWPTIATLFLIFIGCYETPVPVRGMTESLSVDEIVGKYDRQGNISGDLEVVKVSDKTYRFKYLGNDGREVYGQGFVTEHAGLKIAHSKKKPSDDFDLFSFSLDEDGLVVRIFKPDLPKFRSSAELRAYISENARNFDQILEPAVRYKRRG